MKREDINKIFNIFKKENPEPKTELIYKDNYTLLVAVVLSAQSTDVGVNKATKKLFEVADNPQDMINLGEDGLKKYINIIGLYNQKAKNVIALSKIILEKFAGKIPENLESLQSLPGVGRKTANVVLNCAFGHDTMGVDTHVFRVSNRIGLVKEDNVLKTELALLKNIPKKFKKYAHHWLILHGRYTCLARKPKCDICKINNLCKDVKKAL
jgi:endonuclease III